MNVDEARELIVERTERLLELINSDTNVQPYLYRIPYDYTDVEVSVLFVEEDKQLICVPTVSCDSLFK